MSASGWPLFINTPGYFSMFEGRAPFNFAIRTRRHRLSAGTLFFYLRFFRWRVIARGKSLGSMQWVARSIRDNRPLPWQTKSA